MYAPKPIETLPVDPTLEEVRMHLAPFVAEEAVFDGWTPEAVARAAETQGIDADVAALAFKGGAMAMIEAWIGHVDALMLAHFTPDKVKTMKIRERITALMRFRIEAVLPVKEAVRRAMAIMANPRNVAETTKISWRSADLMWRIAGDTATDYNHYTKRAILTGVYGSTLLAFMEDESEDHEETWAFLDRRIENVMQFEKTKAKLLNREVDGPSLTRFLGRLRYPAR